MFLPVLKSITVSAPHFVAQRIFSSFFLDRRGHGAVANVRVDLYQKITPDNHRLGFGMIDICGNDGAPSLDLRPHEFGCYLARDVGAETFAYMFMCERIAVGSMKRRIKKFGVAAIPFLSFQFFLLPFAS